MECRVKPGNDEGILFTINAGPLQACLYRAAEIERSTASLGQQSTFRPAFFW
jgi:hypothetical protein